MPLFKKVHHNNAVDQPPMTADSASYPMAGTGAAGASTSDRRHHHQAAGGIQPGMGMSGDPNYNSMNTAGHGITGHKGQGHGNDSGFTGGVGNNMNRYDQPCGNTMGGMQLSQAAYGANNSNIPSTGAINSDQNHPGSGSGHAITGKVERVAGTLFGSQSLKEKGLQKEQEAQAYKIQGSELAEAERLEKEAHMRRDRAVAHGAHPDHKHLGGINPNASNNNMDANGLTSGNY